ncbi:hypothetical protein HZC32_03780, partial [Candidatus Woesearchaeota archaeon]|nr:hypothetical protein [Candidatus Woesearchaeota archaeon]
QFVEGYTNSLGKGDKFKFTVSGDHYLTVDEVAAGSVTVNITSTLHRATLLVGKEQKFDLTGDNYYDLSVKLNSINSTSSKASLTVKKVMEAIAAPKTPAAPAEALKEVVKEQPAGGAPEGVVPTPTTEAAGEEVAFGEEFKAMLAQGWFWMTVVLVFLVIVLVIFVTRRYQEHKRGER